MGLLFAIEAALPFVEESVGNKSCSSAGGPEALRAILKDYDWPNQRVILARKVAADHAILD